MKLFSKIKKIITPEKVANAMMFSGCQTGNIKKVRQAIELGADVNAQKKIGQYWDGVGGRNNPDWEGDVYASPLVVAATSALDQQNQQIYRDIIKMLIDKGANTSTVVSGVERVWEDDQNHIDGFSPDTVTPYHFSLGTVLKRRKTKRLGRPCYHVPAEMYPISDDMAIFLRPLMTDELAEREQKILLGSEKERSKREKKNLFADLTGKTISVRHVIRLRKAEEKARLKIAKKLLLEKYCTERS